MPDAKQCSVTLPIGAARTLRCRSRSVLTLVTRDKDGNTCTRGGARVEVAARAVGSVQPGQVVDNGNGTYGLVLELDVEGDWEITATVDGTPAAGMPIKVHAAYEPITAAECEIGEIDLKAALTAGQSSKLIVQVCFRVCVWVLQAFVVASFCSVFRTPVPPACDLSECDQSQFAAHLLGHARLSSASQC